MQPIRYLPIGFARIAVDKLERMGYNVKTHDIYYAHKLEKHNIKRKVIQQTLYGMAVNEYQRRQRINQKVVKL